jgi:hypothetical protein
MWRDLPKDFFISKQERYTRKGQGIR